MTTQKKTIRGWQNHKYLCAFKHQYFTYDLKICDVCVCLMTVKLLAVTYMSCYELQNHTFLPTRIDNHNWYLLLVVKERYTVHYV
jgi:hypothetical protein